MSQLDNFMDVVLSVGGSMVNPDGKPDVTFLKNFAKIIGQTKGRIGILTGGGFSARLFANAARELGSSEYDADNIAIISTKQNASIVVAALASGNVDVDRKVYDNFDDAKRSVNRVVVMGGTIPGITTDTDAVLLAEAMSAKRLLNISNVDGIYDSNPKTNPKAKKFTKMDYGQLIELANKEDQRKAGTNFVFDMLACKLIARSGIETHFVSGKNLDDIKNAIDGKKHGGTVVN
jgi:uridylate kinase